MKNLIFFLGILFIFSCSKSKEITQIVEISCGQCNFDMTPKGCDLAVRIDGISYFVDGANIDDFGDAHDENKGFCEVIRKEEVTGLIVDNRFQLNNIKFITNFKFTKLLLK